MNLLLAYADLERRHENVKPDQQKADRDQRRLAAAGQDAVIDLQHVERPGEHQQIDHQAEGAKPDGRAAQPFDHRGEKR